MSVEQNKTEQQNGVEQCPNLGPYRTSAGTSPMLRAIADVICAWRVFWGALVALRRFIRSQEDTTMRLARYAMYVVLVALAIQIGKGVIRHWTADKPRAEIAELQQELAQEVYRRRETEVRLQAANHELDTQEDREFNMEMELMSARSDLVNEEAHASRLWTGLRDEYIRNGRLGLPGEANPVVMDDQGKLCHDSELLGPDGHCPDGSEAYDVYDDEEECSTHLVGPDGYCP